MAWKKFSWKVKFNKWKCKYSSFIDRKIVNAIELCYSSPKLIINATFVHTFILGCIKQLHKYIEIISVWLASSVYENFDPNRTFPDPEKMLISYLDKWILAVQPACNETS